MILHDIHPSKFVKRIKNKQVYIYGAGRTMAHCAEIYCLNENLVGVVDSNPKLWGQYVSVGGKKYSVQAPEQMINEIQKVGVEKSVCLISATFYAKEIFDQLNQRKELEKLDCYLHILLRNHSDGQSKILFTKGKEKIPKIIHYFWCGKRKIPKRLQDYIDTWEQKCPDYKIVLWNEENYDISKNRYMKEAYENEKWGFVSDYARLDIVYQYGGIYLDTDVELLKSLDALLKDDAFFGMCGNDQVNLGSGFGAVAKHPLIRKLRDYYNDMVFCSADNSLNLMPCYHYQHPVLIDNGFKIKNVFQKRNNVVIYPTEVLSPTGVGGMGDFYTDKTVSIHHTELSWINDAERKKLQEVRERIHG